VLVNLWCIFKEGMHRILFVFVLYTSSHLFGQIDEVRRITKTLCSEGFHGRGYVQKGDSIAADFIANEFQKLDLKPLKKSYFQSFNFDVNSFPKKMELSSGNIVFKPAEHFLVDPSSGSFSGELKVKRISIEDGLNTQTLAETLRMVMSSDQFNGILLDFASATVDEKKLLAGMADELANYVPVIETVNSKFTWSVSQTQKANCFLYLQDSVDLDQTVFNVQIDAELLNNYSSQNVVGFLPSKKKCAPTFVYTAHYDHLGRMGENNYFPGGNDNASGTAMLISMAKYFKENPINANILFIAFGGEEVGLLGSKHFVENPLIKLKKIDFLVNLDIMGSGEEGITIVNGSLFEKEFKMFEEINREQQLLKVVKSRGPAANSDHYWFTEKGVPAFFIYTMGPNKNYHDIFDTYENLSFSEYDDITTLLVSFFKMKSSK